MATPVHMLTRYEFTETELMAAQLLPEPNLQFIKTMMATDTLRLKNLEPDPNNYPKFIQEHAAITGAISAWAHLINSHEETIARLKVD